MTSSPYRNGEELMNFGWFGVIEIGFFFYYIFLSYGMVKIDNEMSINLSLSLVNCLNFWWYDILKSMKWVFSIITITSIYVKSLYYQTEIRLNLVPIFFLILILPFFVIIFIIIVGISKSILTLFLIHAVFQFGELN